MISLFVALYSLLCLCTAVKTSDIKELHVRTVKSGEDVTIACDLSLITDKSASSRKPEISSNQADDEDVLNYAAVSFAKKPSSSRTSRDQRHEDVYAQVRIK
ncbi:hypothetical protein HF521_012434 [Silurus meridionalis]|uniref:Uncharacterized protein n=1 Tax=Silurus meridionalis TaxID=175797 RepID=A0A8T0AEQ9_SILME|nr:hypothetical protein HF521_012434 [Silurus meridionalis]